MYTLRRWAQKMTFKSSFIKEVFPVMKGLSENMNQLKRGVVLSFDKMYLTNRLEFEPTNEQIFGPYNSVLVRSWSCARGLFGKWKQPIFSTI